MQQSQQKKYTFQIVHINWVFLAKNRKKKKVDQKFSFVAEKKERKLFSGSADSEGDYLI